jgi:hypothetical protein
MVIKRPDDFDSLTRGFIRSARVRRHLSGLRLSPTAEDPSRAPWQVGQQLSGPTRRRATVPLESWRAASGQTRERGSRGSVVVVPRPWSTDLRVAPTSTRGSRWRRLTGGSTAISTRSLQPLLVLLGGGAAIIKRHRRHHPCPASPPSIITHLTQKHKERKGVAGEKSTDDDLQPAPVHRSPERTKWLPVSPESAALSLALIARRRAAARVRAAGGIAR